MQLQTEFGAVLVFIILGILFVAFSLFLGSFLRKRSGKEDQTIYECGEPTIGSAWIRYNSRFYNVALVYLLFDIEVVLLLPVLLVFRQKASAGMGAYSLAIVLAFIALLVLGLAYEWRWGNLNWIQDKPGENN